MIKNNTTMEAVITSATYNDLTQEHLLIESKEKIVDGCKVYCKRYSNGICRIGLYDEEGKWWSSNRYYINYIFNIPLVECVVDKFVTYFDARELYKLGVINDTEYTRIVLELQD